jgi:6-phosphogluconolactonase (cycloisomerase 2 family)
MKQFSSFVFVSSYNDFDQLAHSPHGAIAKNSLRVFGFDADQGTLTLLSLTNVAQNPAFLRYSRVHNILYACTESIENEDSVRAYAVCPVSGKTDLICSRPTGGKSCCYITIDRNNVNLLCVNYWDAMISSFPLDTNGGIGEMNFLLKPPETGHLSRKISRQEHQSNRHTEAHTHALVLDPYCGKICYVPDLGEDKIKQLNYDSKTGRLRYTCSIDSGSCKTDTRNGPRYMDFHPSHPVAYCLNEISSTLSVFIIKTNRILANEFDTQTEPTLELIQELSTIPIAYPRELNTCGRLAVDPSGKFIIVSNRGHNSFAVFKISNSGMLESIAGHFHTRGETPRHFQFDPTGKFIIVANQDTNDVAIFTFDDLTGIIRFTGGMYVPSPNFICCVKPYDRNMSMFNRSALDHDKKRMDQSTVLPSRVSLDQERVENRSKL